MWDGELDEPNDHFLRSKCFGDCSTSDLIPWVNPRGCGSNSKYDHPV